MRCGLLTDRSFALQQLPTERHKSRSVAVTDLTYAFTLIRRTDGVTFELDHISVVTRVSFLLSSIAVPELVRASADS
jgi:hypothetical protein